MSGKVQRPPFVIFDLATHGTRDPKHFVLHMTEGYGSIEWLAGYFRDSGPLGVTFITEPNGRMGMLREGPMAETYHVLSHNSECIGVEQIGFSSRTRRQWLTTYKRQFWAVCWIGAWAGQELDIPTVQSAKDRRWIAPSGYCQHSDVPDNGNQ